MKLIVRKISRAKWDSIPDLEPDNIQADAITSDLRTRDNKLSFWKCESEENLDDVVLALASMWDRLSVVDLAWTEISSLKALGIQLQETPGDTLVTDLKDSHVDIMNLDLQRISDLARLFACKIRQEKKHKRFSKSAVKKLITDAVEAKRLPRDDLKEDIRAAIKSELPKKN
jgi:hypothetical protein